MAAAIPPEPLMGEGQLNDPEAAAALREHGVPLMAGCRWCLSTVLLRRGGYVCMGCDTPGADGRLAEDDPRLPPEPA